MISALRSAWYLFSNFNRNTLRYWSRVAQDAIVEPAYWHLLKPTTAASQTHSACSALFYIAFKGYGAISYTKESYSSRFKRGNRNTQVPDTCTRKKTLEFGSRRY